MNKDYNKGTYGTLRGLKRRKYENKSDLPHDANGSIHFDYHVNVINPTDRIRYHPTWSECNLSTHPGLNRYFFIA